MPKPNEMHISDAEWLVLEGVLAWLRQPISQDPPTLPPSLKGKFTIDQAFADAFSLRLRLFHSLHSLGEVMTKKAFEYAFEFAATAAGHKASVNPNDTTEAADIIVDEDGFSLKTEASKQISKKSLTISKLMEAGWMRGVKDLSGVVAGIHKEVLPRLLHSKRVFVLRAFGRLGKNPVIVYELVEIPLEVLVAVQDLKESDFSQIKATTGTTQAIVRQKGEPIYTLVFDGSVEKVTIRALSLASCIVHARWKFSAPGAD